MPKVLISDALSNLANEVFKNNYIEVDTITDLKPSDLREIIHKYDGLVVRSATKVTKNIMEVAKNLKIDSVKLQPWIDAHVPEAGSIKSIEQFRGGQSNPTYKIITDNKNLVLRRKPPGKLLPSAHAVDREYKVITALGETDFPVPKTYGLCEDEDVAGTAFFVMDCLDGDIYWDHMLPSLSKEQRIKVYQNKNKTLAALHSVDYKKVGLEDYGKSGNYVARQVSRWSKQYIDSETENIDYLSASRNPPAPTPTGSKIWSE